MLRGIHAWMTGTEQVSEEGYVGDYAVLIRSQNSIGWRQMFNGRWSTMWAILQGRFLNEVSSDGTSPLGNKWNVVIIKEIWDTWLILWKARNAIIHGKDDASRRAAEVTMIRRRIQLVYALESRVEPILASVFNTPLDVLWTKGLTFLKNWLAVYEKRLYDSADRQRARDVRGMRPLETYFGHIDDPG
jgi:hypothetical protein